MCGRGNKATSLAKVQYRKTLTGDYGLNPTGVGPKDQWDFHKVLTHQVTTESLSNNWKDQLKLDEVTAMSTYRDLKERESGA